MRAVLIASAFALTLSLFGTPLYIRFLVRRGYGQFIRDDGPTTHHTKRGTPTMGGAVIIAATLAGYLLAHPFTTTTISVSAVLILGLMVALGIVGWLDDFIKISRARSLGLRSWQKLVSQIGIATVFAVLVLQFPDERGVTPASTAVSFVRDLPIDLLDLGLGPVVGIILFVLWINLLIAGASNGVNLTDGLDGLATGATVAVAAAYILIGTWQFNQNCVRTTIPGCYPTPHAHDAAILAAALMGSCVGFLWWNASPAKIFMGDTGSLALGGALAGLAIITRTELLLVILGGLFVIITFSVIIQVASFKMTGRRVFRMAPLQHHFELKGWNEVTIVIRFWIIAGLCVALGIGLFYAESLVGGVV